MKYLFALLFLTATSASADVIDAVYKCSSDSYYLLLVKVISATDSGTVVVSDWVTVENYYYAQSECKDMADRLNSK